MLQENHTRILISIIKATDEILKIADEQDSITFSRIDSIAKKYEVSSAEVLRHLEMSASCQVDYAKGVVICAKKR